MYLHTAQVKVPARQVRANEAPRSPLPISTSCIRQSRSITSDCFTDLTSNNEMESSNYKIAKHGLGMVAWLWNYFNALWPTPVLLSPLFIQLRWCSDPVYERKKIASTFSI